MTKEADGKDLEIVYPNISILAEPPVAVVEANAVKHGNLALATAYLAGLFEPDAQDLVARYGYRPVLAEVADSHRNHFPNIELTKLSELGSWKEIQQKHFADGGIFDQLFQHQELDR